MNKQVKTQTRASLKKGGGFEFDVIYTLITLAFIQISQYGLQRKLEIELIYEKTYLEIIVELFYGRRGKRYRELTVPDMIYHKLPGL